MLLSRAKYVYTYIVLQLFDGLKAHLSGIYQAVSDYPITWYGQAGQRGTSWVTFIALWFLHLLYLCFIKR